MSRLKALLRVSGPSTCNTQQTHVPVCKPVAQHAHTKQQQLLHVVRANPCNTQQTQEEQTLRRWLRSIRETDPQIIAALLDQCRRDADARVYFLKLAGAWSRKKDYRLF